MRIGIDARFYGTLGKGLGRYTSELIAHLEKQVTDDDYVIFLRQANFDEYVPQNPRFTKVLAEFPWYTVREQVLYPSFLAKHRVDLMHFPHFNVPYFYRRPYVVTIHDLILLSHPTTRATTLGPIRYAVKYALYRLAIGRAIRDAKTVITVSECTKKEILARFPAAGKQEIAVTYEACATAFRDAAPTAASRADDVNPPFVLYVGNAYPHKNLERLIEAFALFRKRGNAGHRLVLVGAPDYFYDRLADEARKRGLMDGVVFFGHATDDELSTLYGRAEFYVFPSLCEGFGLPPLEAMCKGLPVTSSEASCLPEILGDAALYFDPKDPTKIADALDSMAKNAALRATLVERGRANAARFDWNACATETAKVYAKALRKA